VTATQRGLKGGCHSLFAQAQTSRAESSVFFFRRGKRSRRHDRPISDGTFSVGGSGDKQHRDDARRGRWQRQDHRRTDRRRSGRSQPSAGRTKTRRKQPMRDSGTVVHDSNCPMKKQTLLELPGSVFSAVPWCTVDSARHRRDRARTLAKMSKNRPEYCYGLIGGALGALKVAKTIAELLGRLAARRQRGGKTGVFASALANPTL